MNRPGTTSTTPRGIDRLAGGLAVLLGVLVCFAWVVDYRPLMQLHPSFVPMQFNTALVFTLLGTALLFPGQSWGGVLIAAGASLSGLVLLQDLTGTSLGVDELFIRAHVDVATPHPGLP